MDESWAQIEQEVRSRLERGQRVARTLPGGGRIMLDRPLPFICVHRSGKGISDPGIDGLLRSQACYVVLPAGAGQDARLRSLLQQVVAVVTAESKSFLVIELWAADRAENPVTFKAMCPADNLPTTSAVLEKGLQEVAGAMRGARAEMIDTDRRHPAHARPLLTKAQLRASGTLTIGIEIPPVYRTPDGHFSRLALRMLRSRFSDVLKRTIFDFVRVQTSLRYPHHLTLGQAHLARSTRYIDRRLTQIAMSFDVLLHVTPVNTRQAWAAFRRDRYQKEPGFHYRLVPVDPDLVKRQLFQLRINEVEDPAVEFIFRDKRNELETQLTLLAERGTRKFMYSGLRLHGDVDDTLLKQARALHQAAAAMVDTSRAKADRMDANEFAALAAAEIAYYQKRFPKIPIGLRMRDDVDGVLVSRGQLLISKTFSVERTRAAALVQHEVGTHILTYCNGSAQPLKLLALGLAGYTPLQEGLAVLAEHLMDGLGAARMKLLASRVIAVDAMVRGATFVDCFRLVRDDLGHTPEQAFSITTRVYRGGGFAKDAAYLRGLHLLIDHLRGDPTRIDLLYTGKFGVRHLRLMEDLRHRGILATPVLPTYLHGQARQRLAGMRIGMPLEQLIQH